MTVSDLELIVEIDAVTLVQYSAAAPASFSVINNFTETDAPTSFSVIESTAAPATFSVTDLVAPEPSNVYVIPTSGKTVYITWDCDSLQGLEFEVYLAIGTITANKILVGRTTKNSVVIRGLPSNTSLYFWIASFIDNDNRSDLVIGYKGTFNSSKLITMNVTGITGSSIPAGTTFAFRDQDGVMHALSSVNSVTL